MKIQEMGVLSLLPTLLNPQSSCTPKVANIIAELAKNGEVEFLRLSMQEHPDFEFLNLSALHLVFDLAVVPFVLIHYVPEYVT